MPPREHPTLLAFRRRWFRFSTFRSDYTRLAVFIGPLYVVWRDSSYDESHIPTSHLRLGRFALSWRHRG